VSQERLLDAGRPPRVLFFGSRRWASLVALHELMRPRVEALPSGAVVVHGDAPGADRAAEHVLREVARMTGARYGVLRAPDVGGDGGRWHRRNWLMASLLDGPEDRAEAFLSGRGGEWTPGSADMMRILVGAGVPFEARWLDGTVQPGEAR
jgi:hypothetical protein